VNKGKNVWFVVVSSATVEPAPVNPLPSPTNDVAVITPETLIPVELIVTPDPTNEVAVTTPVTQHHQD